MSWRMTALLFAVFICCACAKPTEQTGIACTFGPNDALITEVMITPSQDAPEWVEIYNNSKQPLLLHRAVITFNADTGANQQWVIDETHEVPAKTYWVIGNKSAPHVNSVVSHGAPLSARNQHIQLSCRDQVANSIALSQRQVSSSGRSASFEGLKTPGLFENSLPMDWCVARVHYSEIESGTPGAVNSPCGMTVCRNATGEVREVRHPTTNALVLSEIYRDAPGADDNREWVEFYNRSGAAFDLNGLVLRTDSAADSGGATEPRITSDEYDVRAETCLSMAPGEYRVLRIASKPANGPPNDGIDAAAIEGVALHNGQMAMIVMSGIDVVAQAELPEAQAGHSDGLSDFYAEDSGYCSAHSVGTFGVVDAAGKLSEYGTPGAINDPCGEICRDQNGRWRAMVTPRAGELVLTEWYANPRGSDGGYEWVEFYVDSDRGLDLNGVKLTGINGQSGNRAETVIDSENCLSFNAHHYGVIAGESAVFPSDLSVVRVAGLSLYNSAGELALSRYGLELDRAPTPAPIEGVSMSLSQEFTSVAGNDIAANFCAGRTNGYFQDAQGDAYGTPGRMNDPCGAQWCLANGIWRTRNPLGVGDAAITEIYYHAGGANDGQDWLEVVALANGDLGGVVITQSLNGAGNGRSWSSNDAQCLAMRSGDRVIFAGKNSNLISALHVNGDDFYSTKSTFELSLDGVIVDSANVPKMAAEEVWVAGSGPVEAVLNDNVADWCHAVAPTPGGKNSACVSP